jgi:hypothetical protein
MAGEPATTRRRDQQPGELARHLVLELCVDRLLGHIFPAGPEFPQRYGRHRVLADVVARSPRLRRALLDGDEGEIQKAWSVCLTERRKDLRLHHTLAVLYRERALATPAGADDDGRLVVATALWGLLLGTRDFWDEAGENVARWQGDLLTTLARELFTRHATEGRRVVAEGRFKAAEPHLRCLVAGQSGPEELVRILVGFGLPYRHIVDEQLSRQVGSIAREVLGGWCADVVRAARKVVDDPDAIAELPEGITNNWAGGIDVLQPFVRIGVPVKKLLRTGLEWYVKWWYNLNRLDDLARIRKQLEPAARFADGLIPLCTKGQGHKPENQALSRYFMFCGFATDDAAEKTSAQDKALEWNPNNDNARNLRVDAQIGELLDKVSDAIDEKNFTAVVTYLRAALDLADDQVGKTQIRKRIAPAYNAAGVAALEAMAPARDRFAKALTETLDSVKSILPGLSKMSSSLRLSSLARSNLGTGCAVCDSSTAPRRRAVIFEILDDVIATGEFEATSAVAFWRAHGHLLCSDCQKALDDIREAVDTARTLFEDALMMDPNGTSAGANLQTIQEMDA